MGGGYTNVIPIPVDGDPQVKAIAGAMFKPEGAGPFPAVNYMPGCAGLDFGPDRALQKSVIDHMRSKGFATLVIDPFTPRGETQGICETWTQQTSGQYGLRGADRQAKSRNKRLSERDRWIHVAGDGCDPSRDAHGLRCRGCRGR
jgi:dienelactone hydrolase